MKAIIEKMLECLLAFLPFLSKRSKKKVEKMKAELSKVLRDAGYANAAEFFTELFAVREEKRKYEEACKVWQEECVRTEIEATGDGQYYGNVPSIERGRTR